MEIIIDRPPNFDDIDAAFNVRGKDVIFAFGSRIYNPSGANIPPQLLAHESVHGQRQGQQVLDWWKRYIEDPAFRLAEEIPAHQAEYRWLLEHAPRHTRRQALRIVADRLAGKLYGGLVTPKRARALLMVAA